VRRAAACLVDVSPAATSDSTVDDVERSDDVSAADRTTSPRCLATVAAAVVPTGRRSADCALAGLTTPPLLPPAEYAGKRLGRSRLTWSTTRDIRIVIIIIIIIIITYPIRLLQNT